MVRHENFRKVGISPSDVVEVDALAQAAGIAIEDIVFWFNDIEGCWAAFETSPAGVKIADQSISDGWVTS